MQVILLERIENLGQIGDEVHVKNGFARNYLLPKKKALRATEANRKYFETQKKQIEAQNAQQVAAAKKIAEKVQKVKIVVLRQAGESGQLYGSVTSRDIARAVREQGVKEVRRGNVVLDTPIKELGVAKVHIRLHAEVVVDIEVNIARTAEEAESQALEAAKVFETEELAKEAEKVLSDEEQAPEEEEAEEEAEEAPEAKEEEAEEKSEAKAKDKKAEDKKEPKQAEAKAPSKKETKADKKTDSKSKADKKI